LRGARQLRLIRLRLVRIVWRRLCSARMSISCCVVVAVRLRGMLLWLSRSCMRLGAVPMLMILLRSVTRRHGLLLRLPWIGGLLRTPRPRSMLACVLPRRSRLLPRRCAQGRCSRLVRLRRMPRVRLLLRRRRCLVLLVLGMLPWLMLAIWGVPVLLRGALRGRRLPWRRLRSPGRWRLRNILLRSCWIVWMAVWLWLLLVVRQMSLVRLLVSLVWLRLPSLWWFRGWQGGLGLYCTHSISSWLPSAHLAPQSLQTCM
jgi:hypothetical protein